MFVSRSVLLVLARIWKLVGFTIHLWISWSVLFRYLGGLLGRNYRQKGHGSGCTNDKRKQSSVRQGIHSEYQQKISDFLLLDWLIAFVKPGDDQRQKHTDRIAGTIVV